MTDLMIIGKNGQLGAVLVNLCQKQARRYIAFDSSELDVTDYEKVNQIINKFDPRIIINTSAFHVVSECEKNPNQAFSVNSLAVKNLAKISNRNKIKLVTYSTDYVFDGKKGSAYLESDSTNPLQVYGRSKLAGEINAETEHPKGVYVIRTCGVYGGKGSRSKKGNFVLNILSEANKENVVKVSPELIVSPTSAKNLAEATIKLLDLNPEPGVYHLVNEGFLSWYDFAKEILKLAKIKKEVVSLIGQATASELKRPRFSALANTKAKKLGVVLPNMKDGLREYLEEVL
jgi:dTDP-4-dehydrorhamnose reductase